MTDEKNKEVEQRKAKLWRTATENESLAILRKMINALVQQGDLNIGFAINEDRKEIFFESRDLSSSPIISLAFEHFIVTNFSSGISYREEEDKVCYWTTIEYRYRHHGGGKNGAEIASAYFDERGYWRIEPAGLNCRVE